MTREWVFLSFAKYKELVDCTKRSHDIVTGYIKTKKPKPDATDTQSSAKSSSKTPGKRPKSQSKPKQVKKPKLEQNSSEYPEETRDGHEPISEPLTPSASEESEEEAF